MKELYQKFIASAGVCTDTRKIVPNSIYFALKGASFDGNAFAAEALNKGATLAIIDNPAYQIDERTLLVPDVLLALQELANYHRRTLKTLIIGITGSNGKTTTKELIKSVLSEAMQVVATEGNLNNAIGVPLTLLSIKPETDIAIVEMGANHPHEIADLCRIAEPDYGYITSIGKAHLEGFGSFEGVIKTKAELYDYLKAHQKTIIYNADDTLQQQLVEGYANVYSFGTTDEVNVPVACVGVQPVSIRFSEGAVLQTEEPATKDLPYIDTTIEGFSEATTAVSHLMGSYNFNNIAAAVAFGRYFRGKDSKDHFIPELKVGYYDGGGYAGMMVSTKHFSPIVGFSFLKFMNVYGGYSIPFDSEKNLNGFSIGVSINIGLTQISKYYDKFTFKLM